MNKIISKIGAVVVTITVFLFAICLIADLPFVSYLVCMFLPLGYIMMAVGFQYESCEERKVSASVGVVIAVIYAVMVLLVYYAQTTSVQLGGLNEQAVRILDFQRGGLLFNYDLLGYGMMALSTLFIGLSINPSSKADLSFATPPILTLPFYQSKFESGQVAEIFDDTPWRFFYWMFYYADDRCIHKHGKRRNWKRRYYCTIMLVCIFSSYWCISI